MRERSEQHDVGIIVGRFQVHRLTGGHIDLLRHVCEQHDKVIVFIGLSPLMNTRNNPLDYEARKQMLLEQFPDINVAYVTDHQSDHTWSRQLDKQIETLCSPSQSAILYGARDSFISHYDGRYATRELEPDQVFSGTVERRKIASSRTVPSEDFRAGAIWASQSRFPTAYCTVDIAVLNEDASQVLLCRKPGVKHYQFIGGFSDPGSTSLEADARREVHEEANIDISDPVYLGSVVIDDWRYRSEVDCIKTTLWVAKYVSGRATAQDDIEEVRWVNLRPSGISSVALEAELPTYPENISTLLAPIHRPLMDMLLNHLAQKGS